MGKSKGFFLQTMEPQHFVRILLDPTDMSETGILVGVSGPECSCPKSKKKGFPRPHAVIFGLYVCKFRVPSCPTRVEDGQPHVTVGLALGEGL